VVLGLPQGHIGRCVVTAARRLELADVALQVLDALPRPDEHAVFTGWIAHRAGLDDGYWVPPYLRSVLRRLQRLGLVERWCWRQQVLRHDCRRLRCAPYWRLTAAGARFEGTAEDLARPIRSAA